MMKSLASVLLTVALALLVFPSTPATAATLYVGPGKTYTEIQPAIDAAVNGDEIVVLCGTYTGVNNKNLDFGGKAITLKSETGDPSCVIIDCEGAGRGFYFHSGETSTSKVEGFTVTDGYAPLVPSASLRQGSGLYCSYSSPTIDSCIFTGGWADYAGGIACYLYSTPTITNSVISGNHGRIEGGGIVATIGSSPIFANCTIVDNTCDHLGAGIRTDIDSFPPVTNCIIWGNSPDQIRNVGGGNAIVTYSDVQGGYAGTGNIDAPPMLDANYHLLPGSPCIDTGDPASAPPDFPSDDIHGDARPLGAAYDMGADEFVPCYDFVGFLEPLPLEDSAEVRTFKSRRVIPVKFKLFDDLGNEITCLSEAPVISVLFAGTTDAAGEPEDYDVTGRSDDGNNFRYSGDCWIFNLSMRSFAINSEYDIVVTIPETGCTHQVRINLVK